MDLQKQNLDHLKELLGNRRAKAMIVAVMILFVVVLMQVGNLGKHKPMCELLSNCKLRNIDLHRMQIALSKSGLSEFEIDGDRILVPKAKHAEYLQSVADQKAIPAELRFGERPSTVSNPFLSRSQQQSIEREAKKRQIQEMVVRLPFVEQAWFEMDAPENRSAFNKLKKSAVISIRPIESITLLEQHVDTVRQMIGGAVAGIDPNQIVVIDLNTGFAYRHSENAGAFDQRLDAQRVVFARQQILENRIRQALDHYPGLRLTVIVEEIEDANQLANESNSISESVEVARIPATSVAGANGQASIYEIPLDVGTAGTIEIVAGKSERATSEKITVVIDVPQCLLATTHTSSDIDTKRWEADGITPANDGTEAQFARFQSEVERIVRPLLGAGGEQVVTFNLIRQPVLPARQWVKNLEAFTTQNWPSIAVLLIGIVLIYLVTFSDRATDKRTDVDEQDTGADILSIDSAASRETADENKRAAETRLSRLIEKDPDAAAKVIENWIRDAA